MKLNHAFAGALALALISLAPAAHAQSALEWAVSQGAAPTPKSGVLRNRGNRGRIVAQAPLDIRSAPQIVAEAARYIGTRNPYRFRGPGCKVFLNMVARRAGYYANASARAFDTRGMGQRVSYPQPGDYRVSARRGGGHAELVAEVHGGSVTTINGNKGGNRVGWSHRSIGGAARTCTSRHHAARIAACADDTARSRLAACARRLGRRSHTIYLGDIHRSRSERALVYERVGGSRRADAGGRP